MVMMIWCDVAVSASVQPTVTTTSTTVPRRLNTSTPRVLRTPSRPARLGVWTDRATRASVWVWHQQTAMYLSEWDLSNVSQHLALPGTVSHYIKHSQLVCLSVCMSVFDIKAYTINVLIIRCRLACLSYASVLTPRYICHSDDWVDVRFWCITTYGPTTTKSSKRP